MSDIVKVLRGKHALDYDEKTLDQFCNEAADEIEKLRAVATIPKRTLELFERVASEMTSEGYAQGYREACNHIMHYITHDTMDKRGEKE
jgi:uncharacterized Zn finger protein